MYYSDVLAVRPRAPRSWAGRERELLANRRAVADTSTRAGRERALAASRRRGVTASTRVGSPAVAHTVMGRSVTAAEARRFADRPRRMSAEQGLARLLRERRAG